MRNTQRTGGATPAYPEERFMAQALELAREAASEGEIPVGCVVVRGGEVIGRGRNRRERLGDATAHAEMEAIREACRKTGGWRLSGCTLYVTLEPCPMCAGAIINARIGTVVYGAANPKAGCCTSVLALFEEGFHHAPAVYGGVLEEACARVLGEFFRPREEKREMDLSADCGSKPEKLEKIAGKTREKFRFSR